MKMAKCAQYSTVQYSTARTMHVLAATYKMYGPPYILYVAAFWRFRNFQNPPPGMGSPTAILGPRVPYSFKRGPTARSAGSHISQFFGLLQFLGHQKIFYKTCMCAVKVALNFLPIQKKCDSHLFLFNTVSPLECTLLGRWTFERI